MIVFSLNRKPAAIEKSPQKQTEIRKQTDFSPPKFFCLYLFLIWNQQVGFFSCHHNLIPKQSSQSRLPALPLIICCACMQVCRVFFPTFQMQLLSTLTFSCSKKFARKVIQTFISINGTKNDETFHSVLMEP